MSKECHATSAPKQGRDEMAKGHITKNVGPHTSGRPINVAFVGRPNSGKSSLYNAITGAKSRVGNFPGVTVDVFETQVLLPTGGRAHFLDLPGLYSLNASFDPNTDEGIAFRMLMDLKKRIDKEDLVIIHVIDACQLALGLTLDKELAKLGVPYMTVLAQWDRLQDLNIKIDLELLSFEKKTKFYAVGLRGKQAMTPAQLRTIFFGAIGEMRGTSLPSLETASTPKENSQPEWDPKKLALFVTKKQDEELQKELAPNEKKNTAPSRSALEKNITVKLDSWLLHPWLGPLLFGACTLLLFAAIFVIADPATVFFDSIKNHLADLIFSTFGDHILVRFICEALLDGAGTVLVFMPQIVLLSLALELLEASGYLARGAFLADSLLQRFGLSGRAFVPILMGHACAVPAIAATRIIRDPKERLINLLILPLTTCSARLPTYALLLTAFFPNLTPLEKAFSFLLLYNAGIWMALGSALMFRRTRVKGKGLPLLIELPVYRIPLFSVMVLKAWTTARAFFKEVGSTIMLVSGILWVMLQIPVGNVNGIENPGGKQSAIEHSVAATMGQAIEPISKYAGFDWRMNVSLIGSFGARELMVGTLGVIYGVENAEGDSRPLAIKLETATKPDGTRRYSKATGLSLLIFFVLACQCMSTVAAIRRETRSFRWPAFVLFYTYLLGFSFAVVTYQIGLVLGLG